MKGRVDKEVRTILQNKGVPYNQSTFDKLRKQKFKELYSKGENKCHNSSRNTHFQASTFEINQNLTIINQYLDSLNSQ